MLLFNFDIMFQRLLVGWSQSVVLLLKLGIVQWDELDFVLVDWFEGVDVGTELLCEFEFEELGLLEVLCGDVVQVLFHGEQFRQPCELRYWSWYNMIPTYPLSSFLLFITYQLLNQPLPILQRLLQPINLLLILHSDHLVLLLHVLDVAVDIVDGLVLFTLDLLPMVMFHYG